MRMRAPAPDERKPRPFIFTDSTGAKILKQYKDIKTIPIMKTFEVYTVDTIGSQITGSEAHRETVPAWLAPMVAEQIKNHGFCYCNFGTVEFIAYPTQEAAEHAIEWSLN